VASAPALDSCDPFTQIPMVCQGGRRQHSHGHMGSRGLAAGELPWPGPVPSPEPLWDWKWHSTCPITTSSSHPSTLGNSLQAQQPAAEELCTCCRMEPEAEV
jgi:hypothetical protein